MKLSGMPPVPIQPARSELADKPAAGTATSGYAGVAAGAQQPAEEAGRQRMPAESGSERDPLEEFRRYMAMSPAEKIRYSVLAEMDMTVEEYEALPPEAKAEIDEEIAERLRDYQEARSWSRALPEGVNQYRLEQLRAGQDDDDPAPGVFV